MELLKYRKYPISKGLLNSDIENINVKLNLTLPKECSDLFLNFDWPTDGTAVEPVIIFEDSPIGEIVFNGFMPGLQLHEMTNECQENLRWWKNIKSDDFVRTEGPVRDLIYDEDRIFFSYGNGIYWFIDLNPGNNGNVGQIALLYPMYQEHYIKVVAPNMIEFIEIFSRKLGL